LIDFLFASSSKEIEKKSQALHVRKKFTKCYQHLWPSKRRKTEVTTSTDLADFEVAHAGGKLHHGNRGVTETPAYSFGDEVQVRRSAMRQGKKLALGQTKQGSHGAKS
jgi:hypothetical protein